jgi:hypothetical protein
VHIHLADVLGRMVGEPTAAAIVLEGGMTAGMSIELTDAVVASLD